MLFRKPKVSQILWIHPFRGCKPFLLFLLQPIVPMRLISTTTHHHISTTMLHRCRSNLRLISIGMQLLFHHVFIKFNQTCWLVCFQRIYRVRQKHSLAKTTTTTTMPTSMQRRRKACDDVWLWQCWFMITQIYLHLSSRFLPLLESLQCKSIFPDCFDGCKINKDKKKAIVTCMIDRVQCIMNEEEEILSWRKRLERTDWWKKVCVSANEASAFGPEFVREHFPLTSVLLISIDVECISFPLWSSTNNKQQT